MAETAARPETTAPTLDVIDFPAGELYASPAATQDGRSASAPAAGAP